MRILINLSIATALCAYSAIAQSDFNRVEVFGGYSLASTRTTTNSATFKSPGGPETFTDLCSTNTGGMLGTNFQRSFCDRRSFNGFDASVTFNVSKYVGIKGNVTGHFKDEVFVDKFTPPGVTQTETNREKIYNFLGGVQIKNNGRSARFKPFGHVLVGAGRYTNHQTQVYDLFPSFNFDAQDQFTTFAMKMGGGIDIRASKHVDIRVFEVDYNPLFSKDRNWKINSGPFTISSTGRRADNITFSFGIVIH